MDNFHQGGKYSSQIAIQQAKLNREENFTDQNNLSISSLQTDYIDLDRRSDSGKNSEKANIVQTKCTFCGGSNHSAEKCFKRIKKDKEKACTAGHPKNKRTERMLHKCLKCGAEDNLISKCPNPPKYNDKWKNQVRFSEIGNRASQKECDGSDNNNYQRIYTYMACMSENDECSSRDLSNSSQLTNCILYSGETCYMTPHVSNFIPGSLEDTDKHIDVADGYHVTAKQKGQARIKIV